jgi:hypothetical protein
MHTNRRSADAVGRRAGQVGFASSLSSRNPFPPKPLPKFFHSVGRARRDNTEESAFR